MEEAIQKEKRRITRFLQTLGPGLVTGAADDDPSGIATYSQTGAQYGFGLLWTALFMLPMMYVIQEIAARIGIVTGKGLAKTIKLHYPIFVLYILVTLLLIANIINLGADLGAMAAATQLLIPIDFKVLTILFALLTLYLEIFTSYKAYAKILKYFTVSLFAYIITGLIIHQDWGQILRSSLIPHIEFNFNFLFIVVGVLGTTISPYMMFWQASQEVEEEIANDMVSKSGGLPKVGERYINKTRLDTLLGMLYSEITTWFIFITTAGTLHAHGITDIQSAAQAARALEPLVQSFPHAGLIAKFLFSIGIIGTGLLAIPIFAGSASYAVSEIFNFKEGLYRTFTRARKFYLIIIAATIIGLLLNFIGINPIKALIYTAVINGIISVPMIGILLLISSNRTIMGSHINNLWTNVVGGITFLVMSLAAIGTIISLVH